MRTFWFEIFECVRKIALIGLPVFFQQGSTPQLILGLLICFVSSKGPVPIVFARACVGVSL